MPVGKVKWVVHVVRLQQKPQCCNTGVFYSLFYTAGLNSAGWLPTIYHRQPFDDVMANYTSRNSDNKWNEYFHVVHLLSVTRIGGGNGFIISFSPASRYLFFKSPFRSGAFLFLCVFLVFRCPVGSYFELANSCPQIRVGILSEVQEKSSNIGARGCAEFRHILLNLEFSQTWQCPCQGL